MEQDICDICGKVIKKFTKFIIDMEKDLVCCKKCKREAMKSRQND